MRYPILVAGLILALPANAQEPGTYRCLAESIHHWTGAYAGTIESLPPSEYEIALSVPEAGSESYDWAEMVSTGERYALDWQMDANEQLVARREDNRFSMRIDLDAQPMTFAGIGPKSFLTGTCFFEPRTTK